MRLRDILVPVLILGFALPALAGDAGPRPWKTIQDFITDAKAKRRHSHIAC